MQGLWKTLAAPLLVAVVGGYLIGRIQAPQAAVIEAHIAPTELPNPFRQSNSQQLAEFARAGRSALGIANLQEVYQWASYKAQVRILSIQISNNSDLRSKIFEIFGRDRDVLIGAPADDGTLTFQPRISLKPLDPGVTIRLIAFADSWPPDPITILHDGARVQVSSRELDRVTALLIERYNSSSEFIIFLAIMIVLFGILTLIMLPISIAAQLYPKLWVMLTSANDLAKEMRRAEYIRANHPERYAKAEAIVRKADEGMPAA